MNPVEEALISDVMWQGWNSDVMAEAQIVPSYLGKNVNGTLTGTSTKIMNSLHAIGN